MAPPSSSTRRCAAAAAALLVCGATLAGGRRIQPPARPASQAALLDTSAGGGFSPHHVMEAATAAAAAARGGAPGVTLVPPPKGVMGAKRSRPRLWSRQVDASPIDSVGTQIDYDALATQAYPSHPSHPHHMMPHFPTLAIPDFADKIGLDYQDQEAARSAAARRAARNAAYTPMNHQHTEIKPSKGLSFITARGDLNGEQGWHDVLLPQPWLEKLELSSITVWDHDEDPEASSRYPYFLGSAQLKSQPERVVAFSALPPRDVETEREVAIATILGITGFAPQVIETKEYPDVTYSLTESVGTETLSMLLDMHGNEGRRIWAARPLLSVDESVPLMVDLLRSAQVMEEAGIVHGDLTEDHIYVVDDGAHALISDFHHACVSSSEGGEMACSVESGETVSAFRQAPEMEHGHPNAVSNNIWQLGLVFARMLLGGELPTVDQARHHFPFEKFDDRSEEGRERIRKLVRNDFSMTHAAGYKELYPKYKDVLEIVAGMLEVDPAKRWSAAKAFKAIQEVADARKLQLPLPRAPTVVTQDWRMAWQQA